MARSGKESASMRHGFVAEKMTKQYLLILPLSTLRNDGEAGRAARNQSVSIKRTAVLFPLDAETMAGPDDQSLERLDAFRIRHALIQDLLASILFRARSNSKKSTRVPGRTARHDQPDQEQLRALALTRPTDRQ